MSKKVDFTTNLKEEIILKNEEENLNGDKINIGAFTIKKPEEKKQKTNFLVTTEKSKLNILDKIAKKNKISRNELINQFIDYIIENN